MVRWRDSLRGREYRAFMDEKRQFLESIEREVVRLVREGVARGAVEGPRRMWERCEQIRGYLEVQERLGRWVPPAGEGFGVSKDEVFAALEAVEAPPEAPRPVPEPKIEARRGKKGEKGDAERQ